MNSHSYAYKKLAAYFGCQKQTPPAKAQEEIDGRARCSGNLSVAPAFSIRSRLNPSSARLP